MFWFVKFDCTCELILTDAIRNPTTQNANGNLTLQQKHTTNLTPTLTLRVGKIKIACRMGGFITASHLHAAFCFLKGNGSTKVSQTLRNGKSRIFCSMFQKCHPSQNQPTFHMETAFCIVWLSVMTLIQQ